jgi:hypothetical protein
MWTSNFSIDIQVRNFTFMFEVYLSSSKFQFQVRNFSFKFEFSLSSSRLQCCISLTTFAIIKFEISFKTLKTTKTPIVSISTTPFSPCLSNLLLHTTFLHSTFFEKLLYPTHQLNETSTWKENWKKIIKKFSKESWKIIKLCWFLSAWNQTRDGSRCYGEALEFRSLLC